MEIDKRGWNLRLRLMRTTKILYSKFAILLILSAITFQSCLKENDSNNSFDVVIYGGTSAGIIAAIEVTKLGKNAILIEPGKHLGGLTSGGLGATDIGNKAAIGGLSRDFYKRVHQHYHPNSDKSETMWTFEPHVAENIFKEMLQEYDIQVIFNERLKLDTGVHKTGTNINEIVMESGLTIKGKNVYRRNIRGGFDGSFRS